MCIAGSRNEQQGKGSRKGLGDILASQAETESLRIVPELHATPQAACSVQESSVYRHVGRNVTDHCLTCLNCSN